MAIRRAALVAAASTALLGAVSVVTGLEWIAVATGVAAIACACLVVLDRPHRDVVGVGEPAGEPERPPATVAFRTVGMLGEDMLEATLRGRIAVARRALRPLSIIHVEITDAAGSATGVAAATEFVTSVLAGTIREADACGRRVDGVYVFILEETGEDGAVWTAERLRRKLALTSGERRFCAGIASYPSHGLDAEVLDAKARAALDAAREWHRDRIEVAAGL